MKNFIEFLTGKENKDSKIMLSVGEPLKLVKKGEKIFSDDQCKIFTENLNKSSQQLFIEQAIADEEYKRTELLKEIMNQYKNATPEEKIKALELVNKIFNDKKGDKK